MITNILNQSFVDFASQAKLGVTIEEKAVVSPQRQRIDLLADYYTNRVSKNEIQLIEQYANKLVDGKQPHTPDPRLYMRRDLLGLVQDSYALGIADALVDLEDVQFASKKTDAEFAVSPDDKLQRDIEKLQRDIQASQNIVRQTKTLDQYTRTLQTLQNQAQTLNNTQATQTLGQLSQQLDAIKTGSTVRAATRLVNQQLEKGNKQRQNIVDKIDEDVSNAQKVPTEDELTGQRMRVDTTPDTQDYLVKRAIEEKLKYLQNRRDSLASTPPIVLDEDKDFFRWYADKRLVPIANRYQQGIVDKNGEAKDIATKYTEEINKGTTTQAAKGAATDKIVRRLLNIEDKVPAKGRPIKRVQRVVATELAIAYNVGRLKAYMKAGIQYVTISTSNYSTNKCQYCKDTAAKTAEEPIKISSLLKNAYRNQGFNKDIEPKVSDLRYLPNHPYCYCFYKPHPKQDPEDKEETGGVYADSNSWKFILGAGLGVSLVFLAFALTSGRKITAVPPIKKPAVVPDIIETPSVVEVMPEPIGLPQTGIKQDRRVALDLRNITRDIGQAVPMSDLQFFELDNRIIEVLRDQDTTLVDKISMISEISESILGQDISPVLNRIINNTARKAGVIKALYFKRFDKIQNDYNKLNIDDLIRRQQQKVDGYVDKVTGDSARRVLNKFEKDINKQLISLDQLSSDMSDSIIRVNNKGNRKPADTQYLEDLIEKSRQLEVIRNELQSKKDNISIAKGSIRIVDKSLLQQQIANTQSIVERLATDISVLEDAQDEYQDLLEMLLTLPRKESIKYKKVQDDLNRRIKSAQGINLKRFMGNISNFTKYFTSYKYF